MLSSSAPARPSIKSQLHPLLWFFPLIQTDWQTNGTDHLDGERRRLQVCACKQPFADAWLSQSIKKWHKERKESYFLGQNRTKGNHCWVMLVSGWLPLRSSKTPQRVSARQNKMLEFHLRNDLDLLRAELNFCRDRSGCRRGRTETDRRGHN